MIFAKAFAESEMTLVCGSKIQHVPLTHIHPQALRKNARGQAAPKGRQVFPQPPRDQKRDVEQAMHFQCALEYHDDQPACGHVPPTAAQ
jgi:hypothetical protein